MTAKAPSVALSKLLDPALVIAYTAKPAKGEAIKDLVGRLSLAKGLGGPEPLLAKVLEREQGPTTTLDTGLSIPHARVPGLKETVAALGLFQPSIPDPAQPDLAIRAMFLFLSPDDPRAFSQNLQILRRIAIVFQPAFIDKLQNAGTSDKALDLLRQKEK